MEISKIIVNSVSKITTSSVFQKWLSNEKINENDYVVINNSFVHRDVKTTKAPTYITLRANEKGLADDIFITTGLNLKTDFRHFSNRQPDLPHLEDLTASIDDQISNIGQIVFALIGFVQDDILLSEECDLAHLSEIVWNPVQKKLLVIEGSRVLIQDPYDEEALWYELKNQLDSLVIVHKEEKIKHDFGNALDKLQGKAEATLKLPAKSERDWLGLTDAVTEALKAQKSEYLIAVQRCKGKPEVDAEAYNQVLRISYNFANDVLPYLRLMVSVCDLKPIILWSTIGEHFLLSEAFRNLPWTRSRYKASLKNYIDTIGDARNSVFHNIFPFHKALRLNLPSDALQKAELRIFSEYSPRKNANELTFQDKELIDLLLAFTRARQRPVPPSFWEKNIDVMERSVELFEATSQVLKIIYKTI